MSLYNNCINISMCNKYFYFMKTFGLDFSSNQSYIIYILV